MILHQVFARYGDDTYKGSKSDELWKKSHGQVLTRYELWGRFAEPGVLRHDWLT
jgi:hypothetical protein